MEVHEVLFVLNILIVDVFPPVGLPAVHPLRHGWRRGGGGKEGEEGREGGGGGEREGRTGREREGRMRRGRGMKGEGEEGEGKGEARGRRKHFATHSWEHTFRNAPLCMCVY